VFLVDGDVDGRVEENKSTPDISLTKIWNGFKHQLKSSSFLGGGVDEVDL